MEKSAEAVVATGRTGAKGRTIKRLSKREGPSASPNCESLPATRWVRKERMREEDKSRPNTRLCEQLISLTNIQEATRKVMQNKGSAGIDGKKVTELPSCFKVNWALIREQIVMIRRDFFPFTAIDWVFQPSRSSSTVLFRGCRFTIPAYFAIPSTDINLESDDVTEVGYYYFVANTANTGYTVAFVVNPFSSGTANFEVPLTLTILIAKFVLSD